MIIKDDDLLKMIETVFNDKYSIDDAIKDAQDMENMMAESFALSFKLCKEVRKELVLSLRSIKEAQLRFRLLKVRARLTNFNIDDYADDLIDKTNDLLLKLNNDVALVDKAKEGLTKLLKYRTISCNDDIVDLLALIEQRRRILILQYNDYLEVMNNLLNGIHYISNKNYDKEENDFAIKIEDSAMKLGLLK